MQAESTETFIRLTVFNVPIKWRMVNRIEYLENKSQ